MRPTCAAGAQHHGLIVSYGGAPPVTAILMVGSEGAQGGVGVPDEAGLGRGADPGQGLEAPAVAAARGSSVGARLLSATPRLARTNKGCQGGRTRFGRGVRSPQG